jgi:8-oxo-dGTP pyrophosphatase MutT (NUDIX family)
LQRGDLDVLMQRRAPSMSFVPGAWVFPGGGVSEADSAPIAWAGPSVEEWAGRLGCGPDQARAVLVAAVRELFEESGVMLAGDEYGRIVADVDSPDWRRDLRQLTAHQTSLAEVFERRGLVLRADLLGLRGHWLTPEFEPRRYDTYFFAALLPNGQAARGTTTEAVSRRWLRPSVVLDAAACGEIQLLPPTACSIAQLAECCSAEQFVRDRLTVERLMLVPVEQQDGRIELSCRLPDPSGTDAGEPGRELQKEVIE